MFFSIALLIVIIFVAFKAAPVEKKEHTLIHGAGQIGLMAALALFGVDYFTSYFYATGEMMSALHPYGLQKYAFVAVVVIAFANVVFGSLYMYSLGIFNEGGGSYTAAMRYLAPGLSLVVAVVLIQDYIFTIVVSTLSGVDQLLSITNSYSTSGCSFPVGGGDGSGYVVVDHSRARRIGRAWFLACWAFLVFSRLPWRLACSLQKPGGFHPPFTQTKLTYHLFGRPRITC